MEYPQKEFFEEDEWARDILKNSKKNILTNGLLLKINELSGME